MTLIDQIFTKTEKDSKGKLIERPWMNQAQEQQLIRTYQATRDNAVAEKLIVQFSLSIRNAIFAYQTHQSNSGQQVDAREELVGFAVAGFLEFVLAFDADRFASLAKTITTYMQVAVREEKRANLALSIPENTYKDLCDIVTAMFPKPPKKGQKPKVPLTLPEALKKHEMALDNYTAASEATSGRIAFTEVEDFSAEVSDIAKVDDMLLSAAALRTLDEDEMSVVLLAYGFDGTPMTIREIAFQLQMTKSKADRLRASALRKMRGKLGVTDLEGDAVLTQAALVAAA